MRVVCRVGIRDADDIADENRYAESLVRARESVGSSCGANKHDVGWQESSDPHRGCSRSRVCVLLGPSEIAFARISLCDHAAGTTKETKTMKRKKLYDVYETPLYRIHLERPRATKKHDRSYDVHVFPKDKRKLVSESYSFRTRAKAMALVKELIRKSPRGNPIKTKSAGRRLTPENCSTSLSGSILSARKTQRNKHKRMTKRVGKCTYKSAQYALHGGGGGSSSTSSKHGLLYPIWPSSK